MFATVLVVGGGLTWVRSLLERYWPVLGSLYLLFLATEPPPSRYVGLVGLAVVTPLLAGWALGRTVGVGPWAPGDEGESNPERSS